MKLFKKTKKQFTTQVFKETKMLKKHYNVFKETREYLVWYKDVYENLYVQFNHYYTEQMSFDLIERNKARLRSCFFKEYNLYRNTDYFFGCSFKIYKETYLDRFEEFKKEFADTEEVDFIIDELKVGIFKGGLFFEPSKFEDEEVDFIIDEQKAGIFKGTLLFEPSDFEDEEVLILQKNDEKQIQFSLKKRFEYLQQRAKENGYKLTYLQDEKHTLEPTKTNTDTKPEVLIIKDDIKPLNWQGTDLQLTELTKSLKEANLLNPELSQKEIFERFKKFMNTKDFKEADKLKEIRKRTKDKTPFINILEMALTSWIHKND